MAAITTYLCGGINGLSDAECSDWRGYATARLRGPTLDPMRRDYRGKEDESVDEIVKGDLVDIAQSRFVLVNATRPSWGTAMEIVYARQADAIIIAWVGPNGLGRVSPWLRYHCSELHESLTTAIESINGQLS